MKPTFLIQTNGIHVFNVGESWQAAQKYGNVEEAVVIPFNETLDNDFDATGKFVIPYGSDRLRRIGMSEGWQGVFFNENFSMGAAIDNRDDMLNGDAKIIPIKDLEDKKIEEELPDQIFIKPNADNKAFEAFTCGSLSPEIFKFLDNAEMYDNANYDMDTLIVVAPVKEIVSEYRYFIVGGEVVSASMYLLGGRLLTVNHDEYEEELEYAQELADKWLPHETCVMDTCFVKDENGKHQTKIIEFNCLNSSGFYAHNVDNIFRKLGEYYERK